jgi:hypothetical protein
MFRVTWLTHRSLFVSHVVVFAVCAIAIIVGGLGVHSQFASFISHGCATIHPQAACADVHNNFANNTVAYTGMELALRVVPVIIGVFVGAPLFAREFESGAFRFTWTQGIGRNRFVLTSIVLIGVMIVAATVLLGFLFSWYAHPYEVVGTTNRWAVGIFDESGLMLAAWSLLAFTVGVISGVVLKRVVVAMATAAVVIGGMLVGWSLGGLQFVLGLGLKTTSHLSPEGIGLGQLNIGAGGSTLPGSWLVRAWYTGPDGRQLTNYQAGKLLSSMDSSSAGFVANPSQWLMSRHEAFWVSYQPASRYGLVQGLEGAVLIAVAIILVTVTVRTIRRLSS